MSKDKVELTKEAKTAIENYLQSRLGCYGIKCFQFVVNIPDDGYNYDACFEQAIELRYLGIFRHALKECSLYAKVYTIPKDKNEVGQRWFVSTGLSYKHISGGGNGCELSLEFYVNQRGDIVEKYSDQ
jgi:hypothetical protein